MPALPPSRPAPPARPSPGNRPAAPVAPASPWQFAWGRRGPVWTGVDGPRVLGIVNATPDSFTDGGRYEDPVRALAHAQRLIEEGADAIDVGAESTRPGHTPVDPAEEWRRLGPVLAALVHGLAPTIPISVDTRHAEVAMRALDAGAHAVNDVSGLADPAMLPTVVHAGAGLMVSHWRPGEDASPERVRDALWVLRDRAVQAGVPQDAVCLDPGLGFRKAPAVSWSLLRDLPVLTGTGLPVLIGASRKGFVSRLATAAVPVPDPQGDRVAQDRVTGLISLWGAMCKVALVRVHAPRPTREALSLMEALELAAPTLDPDPPPGRPACNVPGPGARPA